MNCSICGNPIYLRGYCTAHYMRWRRHGTPLGGGGRHRPRGLDMTGVFRWFMPGNPPPAPSFTEGCWDWSGVTDDRDYGQFSINSHKVKAHRASHEIFLGPIPSGQGVLHSCDRPVCVQPAHLRWGNATDNHADALERNRFPVGEARRNTKLTANAVLMIKQSPTSGLQLAAQLGINPSTIYDIRNGVTWKHI